MHRPLSYLVFAALALGGAISCQGVADDAAAPMRGWLSWRGPQQDGTSLEKGLPSKVAIDSPGSWQYTLRGRGTPTIADDRVYVIGYEGEDKTIQEVLVCLDASTGKKVWEHRRPDFLSDIIYSRYAIGSPTVDAETGNVYYLTTPGVLICMSRDGELLWERSTMEAYGRLTFPNGRTGAVLIDGPRAIIHIITSGWGKQAPARDRFFAFDKRTGECFWSCTPGGPPKDSSFCFPVVDEGVLYAGLGGGHIVAVNCKSGQPLWKFQMSIGGVNSNPILVRKDGADDFDVIAIHGKENLDSSTIGRMVRIDPPALPGPGEKQLVLGKEHEVWRNDLVAFTSSPVAVDGRLYQTTLTGDLNCVDMETGKVLWHKKLAPDQIHASPTWGDGKLYVPMNNGSFHIVVPQADGCEVLQSIQLEGACLGAPAIANGRIYVHTTEKLYSFAGGTGPAPARTVEVGEREPLAVAQLQIVPGDHCVRAGGRVAFRVRGLDKFGSVAKESVADVEWKGMPSAGVTWKDDVLTIAKDAPGGAFTITATAGGLQDTARLRIVPAAPHADDFENAKLAPNKAGEMVARPRPFWVGATKKWEIRELDGNKVLAKTLANPLFQRTMSLIGSEFESNYTMTVDIRTDGNRRIKSTGGVVNQRYLITLKGNYQALEISSNMERIKESTRFKIKAKTWYRLKTRVDVKPDGSGVVRAKAWPRDEAEPKSWTLEVEDPYAHTRGAPGIYGFVPQSRFRVYLDNISVTSND